MHIGSVSQDHCRSGVLFLDFPWKGRVQKIGVPLVLNWEASRTTMHCPPTARYLGVAALAAISFPYETPFYDVI